MPEESSAGGSGIEASGADPVPPPETAGDRVPESPPQASRRTALIIGSAAVVFVAAVAAAVVSAVVRPAAPRPEYASLPEPCALVGAATLARYLPGATGTPESIPAGSPVEAGSCAWSSVSGGQERALVAQVFVFRSPSAISVAQQAYHNTVSAIGCHCKGVTVSSRPVTGVGNQAAGLLIAAQPDADFATAPGASFPGPT